MELKNTIGSVDNSASQGLAPVTCPRDLGILNEEQTLVFVHIPKTAGTSIFTALQKKFDSSRLCADYKKPMQYSPPVRKVGCVAASYLNKNITKKIIYGHFLAGKYANFSRFGFEKREGWKFITFFRDPLQRALSHYYFWQTLVDTKNKVWRRFNKENWSLERFLLGSEFANIHSAFLWNFPLSNFDFIGITEHMEESIVLLGNELPELNNLSVLSENQNPKKKINDQYTIDPELEKKFKQLNAKDYALYQQALSIFERQKHKYLC